MKIKSPQVLFGFLLLLINIAGLVWIQQTVAREDEVRLVSAVLSPDIVIPDRIRMTFDRDLVALEQIGKSADSLFAIEPALPGKWMWESRSVASFMFNEPLGKGRRIVIRPRADFASLTTYKLTNASEIVLHTSRLTLESASVVSCDNYNVTVELRFNQPVGPDELMNHARFYDGSNSKNELLREVKPLTAKPEARIVLQMARPDADNITLTIDNKLKGDKADLGLTDPVTRTLKLNEKFMYLSYYADSGSFDGNGAINLEFSRELSEDVPAIAIEPEVKNMTVSRSYRYLNIKGEFAPASRYKVKVPSILSGEGGVTLGKELEVTVDMPDRYPAVRFAYSGGIMSPRGNRVVDVQAVNMTGMRLASRRVYDNNLVEYLHTERDWNTADDVCVKDIPLTLQRNKSQELVVELKDMINAGPGIYSLAIKDQEYNWNRDNIILVISDLALTAKKSGGEVLVWVTSLADGMPVSGAEIKGISFTNQILTQAKTDADGIARLKYASKKEDSGIWLVTAALGDDMNYIRPDEDRLVIDSVDQSGRAWPDGFEVMLYPERGVYRPGDKIYLTGVVRDAAGKVPPVVPLELKTQRPDGKELGSIIVKPLENGQGVFQQEIETKPYYQTGIYSFTVNIPGSDRAIGSADVSVESFTPLRMSVKAKSTKELYTAGEEPVIEVSANYLWGQPAASLDAVLSCTITPRRYMSQQYKDYVFGTDIDKNPIAIEDVNARLDEQGNATMEVTLPDSLVKDCYKLYSTVVVTEQGSRSVSGGATSTIDLAAGHLGIKPLDSQIAAIGKPLTVNWACVDSLDKALAVDSLNYTLYAVEYTTVLKEVNSSHIWQSKEKLTRVSDAAIQNIGGSEGEFEIQCNNSGLYRLELKHEGTGSVAQIEFYASEGDSRQSLAMNQPEQIEVVTDKAVYLPGEDVRIMLRSPIDGRALVTLETDRVLGCYQVDVSANTAELTVPLDKAARGCVYIAATVVRKVDPQRQDWLPHRGYGLTRVAIEHSASRIPVEIAAPEKSGPESKTEVTVNTGTPKDPNSPAMVHLWAVDEGILLASDFQTPDPFDFFLSPRRAGVYSADIYNELMPDFKRPDSVMRIGADGDVERIRRGSPVPTRHKAPDVIWNGVVPTGPDGRATVTMNLPKLIGKLRLMATAFDQDRYGSSEKGLILTKDMTIESSCPGFASPGDEIMVPVKVFNNRTEPLTARLEVKTTGPVKFENVGSSEIAVAANSSAVMFVKVLPQEAQSQGQIAIKVSGLAADGGEVCSDDLELPIAVRPASALYSEIELKSVQAGETLTFAPSESFLPNSERLKLKVFSDPAIQLVPAVEKLLGYPYGCVEQTTSQLFALLYAGQILGEDRASDVKTMTQAGIARLWAMQTVDGGLSYWPGETRSDIWGSAYASWYLSEAVKAGYQVDDQFRSGLQVCLEKMLNNTGVYGEININVKALICRALGGFGKPQNNWLNSLQEQSDKLDVEGRVHLAAALNSVGRKGDAQAILPREFLEISVSSDDSQRLTSKLYQQSILLSVLMDIEPESASAAQLASVINEACTSGHWRNTQEDAAAVVALYRYQKQNSGPAAQYTGKLKPADIAFDSSKPFVFTADNYVGQMTLETSGTGRLFVVRASEGFAIPEKLQPYDKQIKVRRIWQDREGKELDPAKLKVGDLVRVRITLDRLEKDGYFDNIAVVDPLPAGMEVENPRLAEQAGIYGYESNIDRADFQDDRVIFFCGVGEAQMKFEYSLRVTAAGSFEIPPIQASSMYDPAIASLGESGKMISQ